METNAQISKSHNPVLNKLRLNDKSRVKKVIGVLSGKGGVGKSFVSSSLAVHAAKLGKGSYIRCRYYWGIYSKIIWNS